MAANVFIDGEHGTTGLQIHMYLKDRSDITLMSLPPEKRRNTRLRREIINDADLVIMCLPDDAAREAVSMIETAKVKVIDTSTAHRVADNWIYGMPEYNIHQTEKISEAARVSNPGCYAIAAISLLNPLVLAGLLPKNYPAMINAISGYSGGGKSMITEFEDSNSEKYTDVPFRVYGLELDHKHVAEIQKWSGLLHRPLFVPSVGRFYKGMIVQLPLQLECLPGKPRISNLQAVLEKHYYSRRFIKVVSASLVQNLTWLVPENLNNTNELRLHVFGNTRTGQAVLMAMLDNLGKGASGQAVQNMNIMLGFPEETGLV